MKQNRDFHRQVRVVYRACRRLYGKEETQDECLKVFNVVFPEMYAAKHTDFPTNRHLSEDGIKKLDAIFTSWRAQDGGELEKTCFKVLGEAGRWRFNNDFIQFCEDIMPVVMRIRKLTPRECFRLMGVSEPDIDKMLNSGISNSACYKLAGNSIVVDVMTNIFDTLLISTEPKNEVGMQLTLF
jgi:site-specific DNA-cytosine methylase